MALFDVDGVFTDGSVFVDQQGQESVRFSRIDGKGINLLRENGIITGVISAENAQAVDKRMQKLKIDHICLGVSDKLSVYRQLKGKYGLQDDEICFCGDDVQDISVLKEVGFSCCPQNAQDEVRDVCRYISSKTGGNGFVREICNLLIKGTLVEVGNGVTRSGL